MNIVVEIDGPVLDVAPVWHRLHVQVAAELGWSALDQATFWRVTRKQGGNANLLPGARPLKLKEYYARFQDRLESDDVLAQLEPHDQIDGVLASLSTQGTLCLVTLGSNVEARRVRLEKLRLLRSAGRVEGLSGDPRKRPGELRALAGAAGRSVVAAASDSLIRAAGEAGLVAVGVSNGACSAERLFRAGAGVVTKGLDELCAGIREGSGDLARAGLLPPALG